MNRVKIRCCGAILSAPEFIEPVWPYGLQPEEWPTFCGSGPGLGDAIVPDSIRGVRISPACFIHDVDWAVSPNTFPEFMAANGRLFLNSVALIMAADLPVWQMIRAMNRAMVAYLTAVCTVGTLFFSWFETRTVPFPLLNPTVQARLRQITDALGRIDRGEHNEYPDSEWEGTEL